LLSVLTASLPGLGSAGALAARADDDHKFIFRHHRADGFSLATFCSRSLWFPRCRFGAAVYQPRGILQWIKTRRQSIYHLGVDGISLFWSFRRRFLTRLRFGFVESIEQSSQRMFLMLLMLEVVVSACFLFSRCKLFVFSFWEVMLMQWRLLSGILGARASAFTGPL